MKIIVLLLISAIAVTNAQQFSFGGCPNVTKTKPYLDVSQIYGRWYEIRRYFTIFDTGNCVSHSIFNVFNLGHFIITKTSDWLTKSETWYYGLEMMFGNGTGDMLLLYPQGAALTTVPIPIPYHIIDTDYYNYAIAYNCLNFGFFHFKLAWILTRSANPPQTSIDAAYSTFRKYNIDVEPLQNVTQTNCPWLH